MNDNEVAASQRSVGVLATIGSVLAAMFGVQSSRVRRRDFTHGNPVLFIGVGVAMTATFVLTLVFIVRALVAHAAA